MLTTQVTCLKGDASVQAVGLLPHAETRHRGCDHKSPHYKEVIAPADLHWQAQAVQIRACFAHPVLCKVPDCELHSRFCRVWKLFPRLTWDTQLFWKTLVPCLSLVKMGYRPCTEQDYKVLASRWLSEI